MFKPTFHQSTIWMTIAILLFYLHHAYEQVLELFENLSLFCGGTLNILHSLAITLVCVLFLLYIRGVNQKGFFTIHAGKKLYWMSVFLLSASLFSFVLLSFFDSGTGLHFALLVLFSTITFQLSRFTDQARSAIEENKLTI